MSMAEENQKLHFVLVTPEKEMVNDPSVDQVNIPGSEGDLGILPLHAPLFTTMRPGSFSYEKGDEIISLVVGHGYAEITNDRVTVLAETAEYLSDVDVARAQEAKAQAEAILAKPDVEESELVEAQKKLFRALARIESKGTE
ncbi:MULTISPECIES: ATP synthase F1 subunit epsilon [unclassified Nitrospina]|uniref:ATP synthase F1 subunit epsilon n=1 Tax=unclassified Nitrospina TaxID=2638683 RepID=UPI003F972A14